MRRAALVTFAVQAASLTLLLVRPAQAQAPPPTAPGVVPSAAPAQPWPSSSSPSPSPPVAPPPAQPTAPVVPAPMPGAPQAAPMPGAPQAAPPYGPGVYVGPNGSFPQTAPPSSPGWSGAAPPYVVPLGPPTLAYDEGQSIPSGYRLETRTRVALVLTGGIVFGSAYVLSVFGAVSARTDGKKEGDRALGLYAPVVGPFIAAANQGHNQSGAVGLMIVDGIAQVGGVGLFVAGLVWKKRLLVREPAGFGPSVAVGPRRLDAVWSF